MNEKLIFQCECGGVRIVFDESPVVSGICHCLICQEDSGKPCLELLYFRERAMMLELSSFEYKTYTWPPFVKRARCKSCKQGGVFGRLSLPLLPVLITVPRELMLESYEVLGPKFHLFYNRRQSDVNDNLVKYQGVLSSKFFAYIRLFRALYF